MVWIKGSAHPDTSNVSGRAYVQVFGLPICVTFTMKRRTRRVLAIVAIGFLLVAVGALARPIIHLIYTASRDVRGPESLPPGYVDDASRLNRTKVAEVWKVPVDSQDPERQLAELLRRAQASGLRVSVAGARHSMGGHTIYPGGIVIDMTPWNRMQLDTARDTLWVQAGALWKDVLRYLDEHGRSVAVMQSNNSFTVGGSISVNCHGWQFDRPPIASTVQSFRLMQADGTIVHCSRTENPELFSLALGGYGLFGIILDVELRVVPNERYRLEQYIVPIDDSLATFDSKVAGRSDVQMVYARLNIVPDRLFDDVIINVFVRDPHGSIPDLSEPGMAELRRAIFRGSAESDYGKELRWNAETKLQPFLIGKVFSRNQLLNESVDVFQNRSADSTDILHEYFVPRHRVAGFVEAMRNILRKHRPNLLNVTVRSVNEDKDTFLRYADRDMFAFVMLFVQQKTAEGEQKMETLTRALIEAALEHEGRYYLPYRLHATREQFYRAYPQAREFFALKRKYDPGELFQNQFYVKYGKDQD
ncbi:MAG: L-gulonolactone oxidase [Pirellulaceae bacterium]|nr:MAG: L-gulonolactone oxidase [Pirellulaceae bacterium]